MALLLAGGTAPTASAAPAPTGALRPVTTAVGDPVTVVSNDFEGADHSPWGPRGPVTLAITDADAHSGAQSLSVTGRTANWNGPATDALALLDAGDQLTVSAWVKLAPGTEGSAPMHFTLEHAEAGGTNQYTWVGGAVTAGAGEWVQLTGTATVPAGTASATLYIEADDIAGVAPQFLVDDVLVTTPETAPGDGEEPWEPTPDPDFVPGGAVNPVLTPLASARGTGDVAALTFDDGPNPGETERLLDFLAANDVVATFCVIGQNIQAEGGAEILRRIVDEGHTLCNHTTSYADMGSWTEAQVEADLKANLAIIRDALGDPNQEVPYFRAPNGSWGVTTEVAVALGMQPLGLGNIIFDWDGNDLSVETLTANLRAAVQPGAVVLVHDGGGVRDSSITAVETVVAERLAEGFTFTLPTGGIPGAETVLRTDFEDGLDGWVARASQGTPTVDVTTAEAHGGTQAALVSNRAGQGDGIGRDLTGLVTPGVTYQVTAWVKMAVGQDADDIWLTMQRTNDSANAFDVVGQFAGISSGQWHEVTATFTAQEADRLFLYFETSFNGGGAGDFLVDDIVIASQAPPQVEDLTPLKETVDFPVGVAIDSRETTGAAGALVLRHFDQLTGENHMKPEAWYDAEGAFRTHPEATAIMDFAQANDLTVYGHVLVWHSQTPAWFFQDASGAPLTDSEADQAVLRERMRTHIFAVAEALSSQYGLFGSETNPLVAWDVVNEVVSDSGEYADGLRRSEWYRILGEEFIDLAFTYADEAFNDVYAVEGDGRPVTLFINDYNTEQSGKQNRYHDLVVRLLDRGVPIDGVGHQFHVNLAMPVQALEDAILRFADLPVTQVVTELDVTTGTPVTDALLVEQGYYYRDAFRVFREHAEELYSVTVWGLTDGRSWRASSGDPLLFDDALQGKPAYYGAADLELPAQILTADVFAADVAADAAGLVSPEWARLPLHQVGEVAAFGLRWNAGALVAYVEVTDPDDGSTDAVTVTVGEQTWTVGRDGQGDVTATVAETAEGWSAVVELPLAGAEQGDTVPFDVAVTDGDVTTGWNAEGVLGTLTLVEALSFMETVQTEVAPTIDGEIEAAWADAESVRTETVVLGDGTGAEATVRTLWEGETLYVLAEVTDPVLDATGSDPWIQDSFEVFIDPGNLKNGPYVYDTSQLRISYENEVSFGTGDENFQAGRLQSATAVVDGGYVVEAAIDLGSEASGLGTFHGIDFQVNDAAAGARTSVTTWANPTDQGYQTTARWGVTQLVGAPDEWWFSDVDQSNEFYDDIQWLLDQGITTGYANGTFRPTAPVSRQAMAAFLFRMITGEPEAPACTTAPLRDVRTDDEFCGEIAWLVDQGIATGYENGTFRSTTPVSRQAMAAFLHRALTGEEEAPACTEAPFPDVAVGDEFCGEIAWLADSGITTGYVDGRFHGTVPVSRQAMAAFLHRAHTLLEEGTVQEG